MTEAYASARAAALRALAMDDTCADAQVALGAVLFRGDWNWVGAERSLGARPEAEPHPHEGDLHTGASSRRSAGSRRAWR